MRNWNVFPSQLRPRTDNGRINYGEPVVRKLPSGFRSFWWRLPCLPAWTRRTRFDFLLPYDASRPLHWLATPRQVSGHGTVWWELRLLLDCNGWSRDRISVGGEIFLSSRLALGPIQPLVWWVPGPFPGGKATGAWCWPPTAI